MKLFENHSDAVKIWKQIIEGEDAVVSCLTIFEWQRLSLKGMVDAKSMETLLSAIDAVCIINWINRAEIVKTAANISHENGIPAIDALILAGLKSAGVKIIFTTDSHLQAYNKEGIQISLL